MIARSIERNGPEVVVIGAGPHGLAVAAHLKSRGVATHTFGESMSFWRQNMPKGMKLRSPLAATDISDPEKALSLGAWSRREGAAWVEPLPIEAFISYMEWFQTCAVPDLDGRLVARVETTGNGFLLALADGEALFARRVVVATGLASHQFRPPVFSGAPAALVSHTSDHADFERFRDERVAVIGRGQSACETAALLSEAGAEAEIICRGPIRWLGASRHAGGWRREIRGQLSALLQAPSAVGPFPLSWLVEVPSLVRLAPQDMRAAFNAASLRAGAAGWLRPRFGNVRVTDGVEIVDAVARGRGMEVKFDRGGSRSFDHVILATGYRFDVAGLGILGSELRSAIACRAGSPVLSAGLESSVRGLHFVGAGAVSSLGPLMRFVAGSTSSARRVTRAIVARGEIARPKLRDRIEYDLTA
jgi:cation diffusion facilitator CzcD-associated flavoprotein CzcO